MEFLIIEKSNIEGLTAAVALKVKVGWQLHGPVTPISGNFGRTVGFIQALTRTGEPA